MWTELIQLVDFLGFILLLAWFVIGAYLCQRYGTGGIHFVWSKDFPQALHDWQAKVLEANKQEEIKAVKDALDRDNAPEQIPGRRISWKFFHRSE